MKKIQGIILYFTILLIANTSLLQAQGEYSNGDLDISSDVEIPSNVDGITTITGNLTIQGDITAFPDFSALKIVQGNVSINNLLDLNLDLTRGMEGIFPFLDSIRGNFVIENNSEIGRISGLEQLDSIGGNFHVLSNPALTNIPSLRALNKIEGSINISGNEKLATCCGVEKFLDGTVSPAPTSTISNNNTGCNNDTEITNTCSSSVNIFTDADIPADMNTRKKIVGNLLIAGSLTDFPTFPALEVVEGHININGVSQTEINNLFPALDSVRGDINIQSNASVKTISGLEELDSIGGNLNISFNAALTTLPDFNNLKFIEKDFSLTQNSVLTVLPSFTVLERIGRDLNISSNAALTTISDFSALESIGRDFSISSNTVLTTLPSFSMLNRIGRDLRILTNTDLVDCCGVLPFVVAGSTLLGGNALVIGNGAGCKMLRISWTPVHARSRHLPLTSLPPPLPEMLLST